MRAVAVVAALAGWLGLAVGSVAEPNTMGSNLSGSSNVQQGMRARPAAPEVPTPEDLPRLVKELRDPNAAVRQRAADALRLAGAERLASRLPELLETLEGFDGPVGAVKSVLSELARLGKTTPGLVAGLTRLLRHERDEVSAIGAELLKEIGPEARGALPELQVALGHPYLPTRIFAVRALEKLGPEAAPAVAEIARLLGDPQVALPACLALGAIGPSAASAIGPLRIAVGSADANVGYCAAASLAAMGPAARSAFPELATALEGPERRVALRAAETLIALGADPESLIEPLVQILGEGDHRPAAARLLGALGPAARPAIPALFAALTSPARGEAERALVQIGPAVLPLVRVALSDPDSWLAMAARRIHGELEQQPLP